MEIIRRKYCDLLSVFTALISILAYLYILLTINKGTSCDEGYYLLSYLPNQPVYWGISQFEFIIRKIFWFLPEDAALILRYVRFIINVLALASFAFSSLKWLRKKYQVQFSTLYYYSLIFLSGILSFGFASPILYYDNLQLFIYLFVFSFFFLQSVITSWQKYLLLVFCGITMIFGVFNYLPSGLLLIVAISFLFLLNSGKIKRLSYLFVGLILGIVIYHFLIRDVFLTLKDIHSSFVSAQIGITKHDNGHLIIALSKYLLEFLTFFVLFTLAGLLLIFTGRIKRSWLKNSVYFLFALFLIRIILQSCLFLNYYTDLFIVPVSMVFASVIVANYYKNKFNISLKHIVVFCLFLFAPLIGVFGTNQNLSAKMLFFMPFWVVSYSLLIAFTSKENNLLIKISNTVYVLLLFAGFFYLVYFNRFHYYYTPKRSNIEIEDGVRFKGIKVSKWQKEFNEKSIQILNKNGFKKGDDILAFYDNFLTVYIVGGYIPSNLIYQFEVFSSDPKNIPDNPIRYIIIIEEQEKPMIEFLKHTNWKFPEDYYRFDLGKAAENLPRGYNSLLFIKK